MTEFEIKAGGAIGDESHGQAPGENKDGQNHEQAPAELKGF